MLKRYINNACALGIITFLLAACTQEATDQPLLADAKSPIVIAAIQSSYPHDGPRTRVNDYLDGASVKSSWTDGDKIQVWVSSMVADEDLTTTCTLDANGKVTQYVPQLYWNTMGKHEIHAWYSNMMGHSTTDQVVDICDQTKGLVYVMRADPVSFTYFHGHNGEIPLLFRHQLAKVRVKLQAQGNHTLDLASTSVKVRNCYSACNISQGEIIPVGEADGVVKMMPPATVDGYFEANVIPDTKKLGQSLYAFEVTTNGKTTIAVLSQPISFEKGKVCNVNITVE